MIPFGKDVTLVLHQLSTGTMPVSDKMMHYNQPIMIT